MIVNCVAYQNGRRLTNIPVSEIHSYISHTDCFVWVALNDATPEELQAMQREFSFHDLALEDAQHGHQRPKIEEYEGFLFVVLHMIERSGEELNVGEVGIFVGTNYVLSVRSGAARGFTDVRARCEREPELLSHGSGYVLYALMDAVVDRYFPILDGLETEIETIEDRMFANQTARANIEALYDLKRKLMTLKHATEPLLEATGKLFGGRVPHLVSGLQDYFRDVYDHLLRLHQSIDSLTRHGHHRDFGGDIAHYDSRNRGHQTASFLWRLDRRADLDCRSLWHELPAYARDQLAPRLSVGPGGDAYH